MATGSVAALWRYPAKSMQGAPVPRLEVHPDGIAGDRAVGLVDVTSGRLLSAKRVSALLAATAELDDRTDDVVVTLPDGTQLHTGDATTDGRLSAWLGRPVRVVRPERAKRLTYEMTFDPPDDDAEVVDIPTPPGSLTDWAAVHLLTTATLDACATARPDLDWDVRRFRPNVVVDADVEPFGEDAWCGHHLRVGGAVLAVTQPTVRCAMPLRAQPGLARQRALYRAMEDLHANHLGIYADVVAPGSVRLGDPVEVLDAP